MARVPGSPSVTKASQLARAKKKIDAGLLADVTNPQRDQKRAEAIAAIEALVPVAEGATSEHTLIQVLELWVTLVLAVDPFELPHQRIESAMEARKEAWVYSKGSWFRPAALKLAKAAVEHPLFPITWLRYSHDARALTPYLANNPATLFWWASQDQDFLMSCLAFFNEVAVIEAMLRDIPWSPQVAQKSWELIARYTWPIVVPDRPAPELPSFPSKGGKRLANEVLWRKQLKQWLTANSTGRIEPTGYQDVSTDDLIFAALVSGNAVMEGVPDRLRSYFGPWNSALSGLLLEDISKQSMMRSPQPREAIERMVAILRDVSDLFGVPMAPHPLENMLGQPGA